MEKELPIRWIETGLLNIVEVFTGRKDANYATSDGKYLFFTCAYEPLRSDDYSFEGDVLILPGNGVNVGEVFYYSGKFEAYQRTYIVSNIKIEPKYLFYHFKRYWKEIGTAQQYGSATNYIKIGNFKDYRISFPPLHEQQRIVAKLDTLFRHLDQIKNRWINFQTVVDSFVESAIVDNSTGNYFKVEKLKNYLEEGTERIGNNWQDKRKVGISAKDGIIELATGQKETFEKYKIVKPGDFVYNAMRVNIGSIGIYEGKEIAITSPDYVVFRIKNKLSAKLLLRFLKSQRGLLEIGTNTQGSVRSRLYFKYLANINYPVATEKIQNLAEKFLSSVFKASEKWKNQIEPNLDKLRQALLTKAFRGELVAQLPTDGDAMDLLEQIKAISKLSKSKRNEN